MSKSAFHQLNSGQRDCLRLVLAHHNSKEIARELGVSPHTVDQRLRIAMRILNVQTRFEAARIFAELDEDSLYQSLIYQMPDVERGRKNGKPDTSTGGMASDSSSAFNGLSASFDFSIVDGRNADEDNGKSNIRRPQLPLPRYRGQSNDIGIWGRLGWILAIAIASALSFGGLVSGLEALSRLKG